MKKKKRKGERESERDTLHLSSSGLIGVAKPIHISSGVPITQTPYTKAALLLHHHPPHPLLTPCILPIKRSLYKLPVFRAESFIIMDYGSGNDSLSGAVIAAANGEGWGEEGVRVTGKVGWMDGWME